MPLFYQHTINGSAQLAVWHITEPEDFFLEKVSNFNEASHPHKRLQHLAGRYLLQYLHPDFPMHSIFISDSKKPLLANEEFHFSISHCGNYAAVIVSENQPVGIDVELISPKIDLVKTRFLREDELALLPRANPQLLTLFWSCKEAIYKWYGKGRASFKQNMGIDHLSFENERGLIEAHFIKDVRTDLKIEFRFFDHLCLAWVVTD